MLFMPETKGELAGNVDAGPGAVEAVIVVFCVGVFVEMVALQLGGCSCHYLEKKKKEIHQRTSFKHVLCQELTRNCNLSLMESSNLLTKKLSA